MQNLYMSWMLIFIVAMFFLAGFSLSQTIIKGQAFERGYMVECLGERGYHWECEE